MAFSPRTVSLQGQKAPDSFIEEAVTVSSVLAHCPTNMSLAKSVYHLLFRRTSTFAVTIMVGAVLFERIFDQGGDAIFEQMNRGVSWCFACFNACFTLTLLAEGEAKLMLAKLARPLNQKFAFIDSSCLLMCCLTLPAV